MAEAQEAKRNRVGAVVLTLGTLLFLAGMASSLTLGDMSNGEKTFRVVSQSGFEQNFEYSFKPVNSSGAYWEIFWRWKDPSLRGQVAPCVTSLNLTCLSSLAVTKGGNVTVLSGLNASPIVAQTGNIKSLSASVALLGANNGTIYVYLPSGWKEGERLKIGYASTVIETTTSQTATMGLTRHVLYVPSCSAVFSAYLNNSQAYVSVSHDNGTTWSATNISVSGSDDKSLSIALIPQSKDVFVAYQDHTKNKIMFVNFSYNGSCGWTASTPFNATDMGKYGIATARAQGIALTACPDGSLHMVYDGNAVWGMKTCRAGAGSNCSVATNWNASNNSIGFDDEPPYLDDHTHYQKTVFCDKDNAVYSLSYDANNGNDYFLKFARSSAGNWALEYASVAPLGSGADTWSVATNSTGALLVVRGNEHLAAADNRRAQYRYCDGGQNCSNAGSWTNLVGGAVWTEVIPAFSAVSNVTIYPSAGTINDDFRVMVQSRIFNANYDVLSLGINSTGSGWEIKTNVTNDAAGNAYPQTPENATREMVAWINGTSPFSLVFYIAPIPPISNFSCSETYAASVFAGSTTALNISCEVNQSWANVSAAVLYWNLAGYTPTSNISGNISNYSASVVVPTPPSNMTAYPHYWALNFSYGNGTFWSHNTSALNQTIYFYDFFNLTAYDEKTGARLNVFTAVFANGTNTTTFTGVPNVTAPISTLPQSNGTIAVSNTSYYPRDYLYTGATSGSVTLFAYLLPTSANVIVVRFHVRNALGNMVPNATVSIMRTIGATSVTVGQVVTDSAGDAAFYMEYGAPYYVAVQHPSYVYFVTNLNPTSNDYTITLTSSSTSTSGLPLNIFEDVTWWLSPYINAVSNETTNVTLFVASSNASLSYWGMSVEWNGTTVFSQNVTGSPAGGVIAFMFNTTNVTGIAHPTGNFTVTVWMKRNPDFNATRFFLFVWYNTTATSLSSSLTELKTSGLSSFYIGVIFLVGALLIGGWIARSNVTAGLITALGALCLGQLGGAFDIPASAIGLGATGTISGWVVIGFTALGVFGLIYLRERVG